MTDTQPRTSIQPPPLMIIPATDLGNVEVSKAGNLYLLTDARGDIRPDGRGLGLYRLDTRILSASILRVNGAQLTLLRGPYREGDVDTIQLTNPEMRRNPADKHAAAQALERRELSVTRSRRIDGSPARGGRHRVLLGHRGGAPGRARTRRRHGRYLRGPGLSAACPWDAPTDRHRRRPGRLRLRRARRPAGHHDGHPARSADPGRDRGRCLARGQRRRELGGAPRPARSPRRRVDGRARPGRGADTARRRRSPPW